MSRAERGFVLRDSGPLRVRADSPPIHYKGRINRMKIVHFTAENVKKLKAIDITPDENFVVLEGKNAQGKTSVMDCIAWALGGTRLLPDKPIRDGQDKAEIKLDIGEYEVTRSWTSNEKSYLKVENKDGFKTSSPQAVLDKLIGDLSFDPMDFTQKSPKDRSEVLKKISGIDLSDLEKEYLKVFQDRKDLKRDAAKLLANEEKFIVTEEPPKPQDVSEIVKEKDEAARSNWKIETAMKQWKELLVDIESWDREIKRMTDLRAEAKVNVDQKRGEAQQDLKDLASFDEQIEKSQAQQSEYNFWENYQTTKTERIEADKQVGQLNLKLEKIQKERGDRMAAAKFPIEGLDFKNGDVSYEGVEFSEISMSQKIRVSLAIAMALNPKIRIVRILNGSLLDDEAMKEVEAMAKEHDFQVWIERVSEGKSGNAIYIENGEVH